MFLFFHYWFSPLFFGCFHCFHWLHFFMLPTFFTMTAFLLLFCQVIHYYVVVPRMLRIREEFFLLIGDFYLTLLSICHSTASATDLREIFLLWGVFYLKLLLPDIWHNLLLSRLPWEPDVLLWRLQGLPLRNTDPTHLFVWITQCSAKGITR